ncbi:MAG: hypothetical protein AAFP97_04955, partial [Pseudomonadota bacterium]
MRNLIKRWEAFLRLERLTSASDQFRARTVYVTAIAFVFIQILNGIQMLHFYEGWIIDHTLLVIAIVVVGLSAASLRYQANFDFFSVLWGGIILMGVGGTALPANVGINTALLPGLVGGIVIIALLGSRRSVLTFCASATLMIVALHLDA